MSIVAYRNEDWPIWSASRIAFAKRLARFFNIPPIALLTINPLGEGRQTAEMLDAWAAIDPKKREDVLRMMRAFGSNGSDQKTG